MSWLKTITDKPWVQSSVIEPRVETRKPRQVHKETAFKFLVCVIAVVFFLFTITFLQRSQSYDFQALAGETWLPFNDLSLLWRSTAFLVGASMALFLASKQTLESNLRASLTALFCAFVFSLAFLFSQIDIWQELSRSGFGLTLNPANSYFYLLTAVHGLHILVGLYVLLVVSFRLLFEKFQGDTQCNLSLTAQYWHFMLGIWCFLFVLLTQDTETYKTIAIICGF